ncbi:MAG: hypothetical protein IJ567_03150 [Lachnospiraceae bacterium]|nr:hypothetical protein [Lachnospiraceae bacterium]
MKRKSKKIVTMAAACALAGALLCGCGAQETADTQEKTGEVTEEKSEITVTFMNGDEQLGTVTAAAGEQLTGYEAYEDQDGYAFEGWYETPTFLESSAKDPAADTFDADTTLYGNFKPEEAAEDTRSWYIVGTGTGKVLADTNWASDVEDEVKEAARLQPTGNATNEFAITLDLYEGDQFQLIHDWAWDGQLGYGYFTDIDDTQFENGGGLSGSDSSANVNVIMDGNYTITLTTDPNNAAQTTISIVRNGDPADE